MCFFHFVTGDGGNDVSMIQAADCGIGIEGKVKSSVNYINRDDRAQVLSWIRPCNLIQSEEL